MGLRPILVTYIIIIIIIVHFNHIFNLSFLACHLPSHFCSSGHCFYIAKLEDGLICRVYLPGEDGHVVLKARDEQLLCIELCPTSLHPDKTCGVIGCYLDMLSVHQQINEVGDNGSLGVLLLSSIFNKELQAFGLSSIHFEALVLLVELDKGNHC